MTNAEVVTNACRVIWTEGDVSRIPEFYAEEFRADYPNGPDWGVGLDGVKNLALQLRRAFPDYREKIEELIADGDRVVVRLTVQGTHTGPLPNAPATGKAFEIRDMTICRVRDGKIVEQQGLSDGLSMYVQLGFIELPGALAPNS